MLGNCILCKICEFQKTLHYIWNSHVPMEFLSLVFLLAPWLKMTPRDISLHSILETKQNFKHPWMSELSLSSQLKDIPWLELYKLWEQIQINVLISIFIVRSSQGKKLKVLFDFGSIPSYISWTCSGKIS